MSDDPKLAHDAVAADAKRLAREFAEMRERDQIPTQCLSFEDPDRSAWPPGPGTGMLIPVTIGIRSKLSKTDAAHCAEMWREITARYPEAVFCLFMLGYDQDPREVWEFSDVRRYVRHWAKLAGLDDLVEANRWVGTCEGRLAVPLDPQQMPLTVGGLGLLAVCGVFGESYRQTALQAHARTVAH
jgi:hypothetical protein